MARSVFQKLPVVKISKKHYFPLTGRKRRMSKIRSAWEIALEKTENIEIDKSKLEKEENIKQARTLAGRYLSYDEEMTKERLVSSYREISGKEGVKDGVKATILQNLTLPSAPVLNDRFERVETLVSMISSDPAVMELTGQIIAFLKQYPEHQKQLVEQLKDRFAPALEQKSAELSRQYGQEIHLEAENDQEFMKLAQQQLDALRKQYETTLEDAKGKLEASL